MEPKPPNLDVVDGSPDAAIEHLAKLLLAIMATESLHGKSQTRLDVAHFLDPAIRADLQRIDASKGGPSAV